MPNPWDVGSARVLESLGFEALATTSAGFAWAIGKLDQQVSRDELVAHVTDLCAATDLPLNVDSERCYPDDPGGVRGDRGPPRRRGSGGVLDRGLRPCERRHRARRDRRREGGRRGGSCTRSCRADGAHRTSGEPHSRGRRPGRHDLAPRRLSRCGCGRRVRARALGARSDRRGRRGCRNPGQRSRTPQRADDRGARVRRRAQGLDRRRARRSGVRSARRRALASCKPTAPRATRRRTSRATRCSRLFAEPCRRAHPKSSSSATGRPSGAAREGTRVAPTFR